VLLDEADSLSIQAQKALRSDIETYQATCRFILTCNYPEKIIPALKSRCYEMYINKTDQVEYTTRAAKVLLAEGIEFEIETLDLYVSTCYPDLRKCLHALQINSSTGKLLVPDETTESEDSQLIQITHLFKSGKVFEGRQALLAFLAKYPTKIENIYRWMYSNLKLWGNNTDQLDSAILIIRDGLAQLPLVGIAEISLSATLIELSRNMQD
jgi:replication factor C small subunit